MHDTCPHDDDPAICPPCVNARRPKPVATIELGSTFTARHPGYCDECRLPVMVGQSIRSVGHRYVHEACTP